MNDNPQPVDPEVAAATFDVHLTRFFSEGLGTEPGWERIPVDELHAVIGIEATREDATKDHYFVLLGAEFYDLWPPSSMFVVEGEGGWVEARPKTAGWPNQRNDPGFPFKLHAQHSLPGGTRHMMCFSHTLEYYQTSHNPTPEQRWQQGTHTVSATLTRIRTVLTAPNYIGPSQ